MEDRILQTLKLVGIDPTELKLFRCKNCGFSNHHITAADYQNCCLHCHRRTLQFRPDFSGVIA